ncbi:MAG: hypothetical protein KAJ58_01455 [Candidatus Pacebacteria bacterium]|nr:hypothetical protein [Candidatus Paceibacterota bacterium]
MKKKILILSLAFAPMLSLAAGTDVTGAITTVTNIFKAVVPLVLGLAALYFIWSLVGYISKAGEAKEEAKTQMIWGVIIMFVMISIWGLVNILKDTANLDTTVPTVDLMQ